MKHIQKLVSSYIVMVGIVYCAQAQETKSINYSETKSHIGDTIWVTGKVVEASLNTKSKGSPAYLNFGNIFPDHAFSVVIWTETNTEFTEEKIKAYEGKELKVFGVITEYRGKPQIVFQNGAEITIIE